MPRKIAYFGLVHGESRQAFRDWERHLARVAAAVVARSNGAILIDLVATGPDEREELLTPGVRLRVLPAYDVSPLPFDATSRILAGFLDGVELAHVHAAGTALCEWATLLCAVRGVPLCVTQNALSLDSLFVDLGLAHLADGVICHSPAVAKRLGNGRNVSVLPPKLAAAPADDLAHGLWQVYARLLASRRPAA